MNQLKELTKGLSVLVKAYEKETGKVVIGVTMNRGKKSAKALKLWTFEFEMEGGK
jgi:hypothetical protein